MQVFNFTIKNQSKNAVDIYIDGYIVDADTQDWLSYWGDTLSESYKSFRDKINDIDASTYNIYINSGGGNVTEAMAIHDLIIDLQAKGKTVNTYGRGIVASAATYILMASKNASMSTNSWFMIHNVAGAAYGDITELENYITTMRKFNDQIRDFYVNATGLKQEDITAMMNAETWLTATEAKEKGFTKNVTESVVFENKIPTDQWKFKNTEVLTAYNQSCVAGQQALANQQSFFNQFESRIMNLFKNAFGKNVKPLETPENKAIVDAVEKIFKDADEELEALIQNTVQKALQNANDDKGEEKGGDNQDDTTVDPKKDEKSGKEADDASKDKKEGEDENPENSALAQILNKLTAIEKENKALKNDIKNLKGGQASSNSSGEEKEEFGSFS